MVDRGRKTSRYQPVLIALGWLVGLWLHSAADATATKGLQPAPNLSAQAQADFFLGQALFVRPWANGLSSSSSSDGLGPLFNARSCASCHIDGGRSNSVVRPEVEAPNLVLAVVAGPTPHPLGKQLQERASPGLEGEGTRQTSVETSVFTYPDGTSIELYRPVVEVTLTDSSLAHQSDVAFAPRVAPAAWTSSAIESVPEAQILAWADPDDADGDGISGRVRRVFSLHTHQMQVGRFGWKATAATLEDQIANAFATDMGLSNRLIVADHGDCTWAQSPCFQAAAYADDPDEEYEVRDEVFDLVVGHSRGLATPAFAGGDSLQAQGIRLFDQVGCVTCHKHSYESADTSGAPPYSDLLLHDLGSGLADTRRQGRIDAAEWRTAPLLGLGQTQRSNPRAGYLHDGRALTVEQAILWHDGEARATRDTFVALPPADRALLLTFLHRL